MCPVWACMISGLRLSPRPKPDTSRLRAESPRKKRTKSRARCNSLRPRLVLPISRRASFPAVESAMRMGPPSPLNFTALSTKFSHTWHRRPASAETLTSGDASASMERPILYASRNFQGAHSRSALVSAKKDNSRPLQAATGLKFTISPPNAASNGLEFIIPAQVQSGPLRNS